MKPIDFPQIEDVDDFTPLPEGDYLCRLNDVTETYTANGDDMWKVQFAVEEGEFKGRYIFDNMAFTEKALKRIKLLCQCLGIDVTRKVELSPDHLIGKICIVTALTGDYVDDKGRERQTNVVPFAGYKPVAADDNLPH